MSDQPTPSQSGTDGGKNRLRHLPELDGMRGIAALAVYFHHVCSATFPSLTLSQWPKSIRMLYSLTFYGDSGVDLFFVLSGFLITSILIEARTSTRYYQDFYWKRALRILPLYLLCLAYVGTVLHAWGYVLLSLTFLVNFASVLHVGGSGPFWSLAIEEQFYLVWPTVVRRGNTKQLLRCAIGLGVTSVLLRFVVAATSGHFNYHLTPLVCDTLAFGAGLACLFQQGALRSRRSSQMLFAAILLGLLAFFLGKANATAMGIATAKTGITLIAGGAIGLCVVHSGSPWLAFFRSRFLKFFGLISYAFYMVHYYVLIGWDKWRGPLSPSDTRNYWMRMVVCFIVTVAISLITRYSIELPAMRLRRYVLSPVGKREVAEHA
jgi:peptidoglycan/LPS O-acetylase OafA/YrhL